MAIRSQTEAKLDCPPEITFPSEFAPKRWWQNSSTSPPGRIWNSVKNTRLKDSYVPTGGASWQETSIIAFAKLRSKTLSKLKAVPEAKPIQTSDSQQSSMKAVEGARHIHPSYHLQKQPGAVHYYMASLFLPLEDGGVPSRKNRPEVH